MLVLHGRPDGQVGFQGFAGLPVEGDGALAPALATDQDGAHVARVLRNHGRQADVVQAELGDLGEADAGLEQQLDDRRIPRLVAHSLKEALVLGLSQHPRLVVFPLRRNDLLSKVGAHLAALEAIAEEGAEGRDLAPPIGKRR